MQLDRVRGRVYQELRDMHFIDLGVPFPAVLCGVDAGRLDGQLGIGADVVAVIGAFDNRVRQITLNAKDEHLARAHRWAPEVIDVARHSDRTPEQ